MASAFHFVYLHPLWIIIGLSITGICIVMLIRWLAAQQLAIYAYLHAVHKELTPSMRACYPDTTPSTATSSTDKDAHLLILGLPGAGKTKELERYQYQAMRRTRKIVFGNDRIPIFIPMKYYDGFLSEYGQAAIDGTDDQLLSSSLFQYLTF